MAFKLTKDKRLKSSHLVHCAGNKHKVVNVCKDNACERSVGTVFQLPSPDAIYSRDEEKERKVGRHLMFVFAHGPRAAEAR
jgi:hypothetical protein